MSRLPVRIYGGYPLDCLQNLYVSLLDYYRYDVRLLGACWPWEFINLPEINDGSVHIRIINSRLASCERLERLYKMKLIYGKCDDVTAILRDINDLLDSRIPVVTGFENYNPPYRGNSDETVRLLEHTIMLLGRDPQDRGIYFMDTMPAHEGKIAESELMRCFNANRRLWYSRLEASVTFYQMSTEELWGVLVSEIGRIKTRYFSSASNEFIYTGFFIGLLEDILLHKKAEEANAILSDCCAGLWGWELGRKSRWFLAFLETAQNAGLFGNVRECKSIINKIDLEWTLAFRLLFMASRGNAVFTPAERALQKLRRISEEESKLMRILCQ